MVAGSDTAAAAALSHPAGDTADDAIINDNEPGSSLFTLLFQSTASEDATPSVRLLYQRDVPTIVTHSRTERHHRAGRRSARLASKLRHEW